MLGDKYAVKMVGRKVTFVPTGTPSALVAEVVAIAADGKSHVLLRISDPRRPGRTLATIGSNPTTLTSQHQASLFSLPSPPDGDDYGPKEERALGNPSLPVVEPEKPPDEIDRLEDDLFSLPDPGEL